MAGKIKARDFFPDERGQQAVAMMARCRSALNGFSQAVYIAEGVQEMPDSVTWTPLAVEGPRRDTGRAALRRPPDADVVQRADRTRQR